MSVNLVSGVVSPQVTWCLAGLIEGLSGRSTWRRSGGGKAAEGKEKNEEEDEGEQ